MAKRVDPNVSRRPTGDTAYDARRRYYRAAERYLKQADAASGATSARYNELARLRLKDALNTYDKGTTQNFSKPIQKIANQLGVDLNQVRETMKARSDEYAKKIRDTAIDLGEESKSARTLESVRSEVKAEQLRQDEAREIFNSPIGKRILGGTVEVWQENATVRVSDTEMKLDREKLYPELFQYFEVDNLADLLEKIEGITGNILYKHGNEDENYGTVKLLLQEYVASKNAAIA